MARRLPSVLRYQHFAIVSPLRSNFPFPIDMLRYDNCRPLSETDSQKIISSIGSFAIDPEKVSGVVVTKYMEIAKPHWHPERWRSFGWELKEITEPAL